MTRLTSIPLLGIFAVFSTLIPVLAGTSKFRSLSSDLKPLLALFFFNATSSIGQLVLAESNKNNLWTVHLYLLIELPLILYVYSRWVSDSRGRTIFFVSAILYIIMWFVTKVPAGSLQEPSTFLLPVSRVILTLFSIYVLYSVSRDTEISLLAEPKFWFSSMTIIYMAGSVMFTALQDLIVRQSPEVILRVYHIYWIFFILIQLFYGWTFLCQTSLQSSGGRLA